MTGPDYQYVISTAQGAEAHFKFKSEQEWEAAAGFVHQTGASFIFHQIFPGNLGALRQEFFSLDLSRLESDVMSLPLYQQICLPEAEVEPELMEVISRKTANKDNLKTAVQTEQQINNNLLQLLDVKTKHLDIKDKSEQSDHDQPSGQETSANHSRLKVATPTPTLTTEKESSPGGSYHREGRRVQSSYFTLQAWLPWLRDRTGEG